MPREFSAAKFITLYEQMQRRHNPPVYGCDDQEALRSLLKRCQTQFQNYDPINQIRNELLTLVTHNHYFIYQTSNWRQAPFTKLAKLTFYNAGHNETSHCLLRQVVTLLNYLEAIDADKRYHCDSRFSLFMDHLEQITLPAIKAIRIQCSRPLAITLPPQLTLLERGHYPGQTETRLNRIRQNIQAHFAKKGTVRDNSAIETQACRGIRDDRLKPSENLFASAPR